LVNKGTYLLKFDGNQLDGHWSKNKKKRGFVSTMKDTHNW